MMMKKSQMTNTPKKVKPGRFGIPTSNSPTIEKPNFGSIGRRKVKVTLPQINLDFEKTVDKIVDNEFGDV